MNTNGHTPPGNGTEPRLCNLCGLDCTLGKESPGIDHHTGLRAKVNGGYESTPGNGYGTLDDGTVYSFDLCEFCLDWLFRRFKIPVKAYGNGYTEEWRPAEQRLREDEWRRMRDYFFAEQKRHDDARMPSMERLALAWRMRYGTEHVQWVNQPELQAMWEAADEMLRDQAIQALAGTDETR